MGFFSRILGRSKPINVFAPVDAATGKVVVTDNVRIKWRPSQTVPPALRDEIVAVCRDDPAVQSASILDVLEQPTGDVKVFVTISFDNPGGRYGDAIHFRRGMKRIASPYRLRPRIASIGNKVMLSVRQMLFHQLPHIRSSTHHTSTTAYPIYVTP